MKIGFDAKRVFQNFTGLGNYSRDMIRFLVDEFPDNQYHLYAPKVLLHPDLKALENHTSISFLTPKTQLDKTFKSLWRSVNLEKELRKDGVDLFHGLSNEIPIRKKDGKVKYIVTIHDLIFKRYPRNYKAIDRQIYNTKFKYACKNADRIIAISEQTKADIVKFYKIKAEKIDVIYQTCHANFKKQYPSEVKLHIRQKYDLPERYLLNVGTIETRKNLNAIIQALPLMKNDLPLVVIGRSTRYMNFIKVQMNKLKLDPSRVLFLKNVSIEELPSIYQMADVFIYPSFFEGFGIPIIEALYSKTPVITTEGGCFAEAGGPNSIYVHPEKYDVLAQEIDRVVSDRVLADAMREKGYQYAQKFDGKTLARQVMAVYERVVLG
jgi:glycosyltransferase involved in cell wall biosynthesis